MKIDLPGPVIRPGKLGDVPGRPIVCLANKSETSTARSRSSAMKNNFCRLASHSSRNCSTARLRAPGPQSVAGIPSLEAHAKGIEQIRIQGQDAHEQTDDDRDTGSSAPPAAPFERIAPEISGEEPESDKGERIPIGRGAPCLLRAENKKRKRNDRTKKGRAPSFVG